MDGYKKAKFIFISSILYHLLILLLLIIIIRRDILCPDAPPAPPRHNASSSSLNFTFFLPFSSSFYSVHQRNEFLELSTAIASYCLTNAALEMLRWCMAYSVWSIRMSWVGPIRWNRNLPFRRTINDRPSGRLLYTAHQHTGTGTSNLILKSHQLIVFYASPGPFPYHIPYHII